MVLKEESTGSINVGLEYSHSTQLIRSPEIALEYSVPLKPD